MLRLIPLFFAIVILPVAISCGGLDENPNPKLPPNSNQEQHAPQAPHADLKNDPNLVSDVNAIIKMAKVPLKDFKDFRRSGAKPQKAMIVLIGENHVHEQGLIDQFRALRKLARPGDIVLLEGHAPFEKGWQNCESLIFHIYTAKRWNQLYGRYDVEEHSKLQKILQVPWKKNIDSLNLKPLKLDRLRCNFWDTHRAGQTSYAALRERNRGLVAQIKRYMKSGKNIFVLAGYGHLPMGDLHEFKNYFIDRVPDANRLFKLSSAVSISSLTPASYYIRLGQGTADSAIIRDHLGFGSTEDVYDFLKGRNYSELIPQYLLARPGLCGEECDLMRGLPDPLDEAPVERPY